MIEIVPINFDEACEFVKTHHRHHGKPQGHKYSIAAVADGRIVGVVIVGRPVARFLDDGWTLEITRCCTDGTKNACSALYAAAWRAARAMGYKRVITYILDTETGKSVAAAGFREVGSVRGRSWSCKSRPRVDKNPLQGKLRFEIGEEKTPKNFT